MQSWVGSLPLGVFWSDHSPRVEDALLLMVRYQVQLEKGLAAADIVLATYPEPG